MRVQLEEKVSVAARMMLRLEAVAERDPVQCTTRRRMSTASAAGGRRAQGEAEGWERCCCGFRECSGDGWKGAATLWGLRRWGSRVAPVPLPVLVLPDNSRWYSRPFVELVSLLRTAALFHQYSKQCARRWEPQRAGRE